MREQNGDNPTNYMIQIIERGAMAMVPEIFIDGFGQISFKDGLIRIELVSLSGNEPEVRQRIIMTVPAFLNAVQLLQSIIGKFEQAGVVRAPVLQFRKGVAEAAPVATPSPAAESAPATRPEPAESLGPPKSPNFSVG